MSHLSPDQHLFCGLKTGWHCSRPLLDDPGGQESKHPMDPIVTLLREAPVHLLQDSVSSRSLPTFLLSSQTEISAMAFFFFYLFFFFRIM